VYPPAGAWPAGPRHRLVGHPRVARVPAGRSVLIWGQRVLDTSSSFVFVYFVSSIELRYPRHLRRRDQTLLNDDAAFERGAVWVVVIVKAARACAREPECGL
jgi:hypothetical protein